jgi:ribosomal protein S18 acetylase RimI-like enzyme
MTVWYLEQRSPPPPCAIADPTDRAGSSVVIERLNAPSIPHYRWLFSSVGGPWNWFSRNRMTDLEVAQIIHDPRVEVLHLWAEYRLVGFAELDRRINGEVELKFFGLFPEWIGRGLGRPLLTELLRRAWSTNPQRVWLHTCSDDHPAALRLYQSLGFQILKQEPSRPCE